MTSPTSPSRKDAKEWNWSRERLTPEDAERIRLGLAEGVSAVELAKIFRVSPSTIHGIKYDRIKRLL